MKLQAIIQGPPTTRTQPTIVFLHGVGSDATVWQPQLEGLPELRCIAFDMPGYRGSNFFEARNAETIARSVFESLADELGPIHVVGLSLGAIVGAHLALLAPHRIVSLLLASGFLIYPDGAEVAKRSCTMAHMGMAQLAAARINSVLHPSASPATRAAAQITMARIPTAAYCQMAQAVWTADLRAIAPWIEVPTLVVNGADDAVTSPVMGRELAEAIPNANFVILPEASHLLNLEYPAKFTTLIRQQLRIPA